MSDLVERLRGRNEYYQHAPLYNEAADRIEELEAVIKKVSEYEYLQGTISQQELREVLNKQHATNSEVK